LRAFLACPAFMGRADLKLRIFTIRINAAGL
jgi:hypothetical protein